MKNINNKSSIFSALIICCALFLFGCSDYLDKEPMSEYLSSNFYNNDGAVKQGTTGCYQALYLDYGNWGAVPPTFTWDQFTPFACDGKADNSSIAAGKINLVANGTVLNTWALLYQCVARCNSFLDGVAPYYETYSDSSKIHVAEVQTLRAYFHILQVSLYGDIPFFRSSVTEEERKFVKRTSWKEIADQIIIDLGEAAKTLPWRQSQWGRVDKAVALGLQARIALYAGSWAKFGHGMRGETDPEKANEYFRIAADASWKIMTEGGRNLCPNFMDLFTRAGQMTEAAKSENLFSMMFSDQNVKKTHYLSFGEQCRMFGQASRYPTLQLLDVYECKNGKRIDDPTSGYNPQKPFENRDPRLKYTVYTHHDTIIGNVGGSKVKYIMELYNNKIKRVDQNNVDFTLVDNIDYPNVSSISKYGYIEGGVGYLWKKYNHFDDEPTDAPTYNLIMMRYAEILLTYAEAKIELGELDGTVTSAINQVRSRASVQMPDIMQVDPTRNGNQIKMRQIVRRERKVEFAHENLHFMDMRRWRIGGLQNAEPTYGFPKAQPVAGVPFPDGYTQVTADMVPAYGAPGSERDINDIASYAKFGDKLRQKDVSRVWEDKFYLWPIPEGELNKCPWLAPNNDGY